MPSCRRRPPPAKKGRAPSPALSPCVCLKFFWFFSYKKRTKRILNKRMGRVPETVLSPFLQAAVCGGMRACRPTHSLYVIRRAGCPHPAAGRHPLYCQPVGGGVPDAPHPLPTKKLQKSPKHPLRVTTLQHPGCRIGANQAQKD